MRNDTQYRLLIVLETAIFLLYLTNLVAALSGVISRDSLAFDTRSELLLFIVILRLIRTSLTTR